MWDGCPVGHPRSFWGHHPQPMLLSTSACPGLRHSLGPSLLPWGCWGSQSRVSTTMRWYRPTAMVAALEEGGKRVQSQPWTLHSTCGCPAAQVNGSSAPCARATVVARPSTAGDSNATVCWVSWWMSPLSGLCPHSGHRPVTAAPWHRWAAPLQRGWRGQSMLRCHAHPERQGSAFALPAVPWELLVASEEEFLEQIKGKPQRLGTALPSA